MWSVSIFIGAASVATAPIVSTQVIKYQPVSFSAAPLRVEKTPQRSESEAVPRSGTIGINQGGRRSPRKEIGYVPQRVVGGPISLPITRGSVPRLKARRPAYGPFRIWSTTHVVLIGETTSSTPAQFEAMLRQNPQIVMIEMIDCPGTQDDLANMRLGRMIRARGISTHVPRGGSVRSGGVELFIAGAQRYVDRGAEFAVHSWMDTRGREAKDYPLSAPENKRYIDYYKEMELPSQKAVAFYQMTNSVPFSSARWFGAEEIERWVRVIRSGHEVHGRG